MSRVDDVFLQGSSLFIKEFAMIQKVVNSLVSLFADTCCIVQ